MKILQEDNGNTSSARLGMFICVCSGCFTAILGVYKGVDLVGLGVLVGVLLGAGIGGKVYQKGKEAKPSA